MKTKLLIALSIGFILGIIAYASYLAATVTSRHWKVIRENVAWELNPVRNGTAPTSPYSHLAALVDSGELEHLDIVLPLVPYRKGTLYWMEYCKNHTNEIAYSYANPKQAAFPIQGDDVLHINIWFKNEYQPIVQDLIRGLESLGKE